MEKSNINDYEFRRFYKSRIFLYYESSMNHYINPFFLMNVVKSYLFDLHRIWHFNESSLKKYQDSKFRQIVSFAYNNVPLYHKTYKKAGISPHDISGITDCNKLPLISKDDIRNHYPSDIKPKHFDESSNFLLSTSGSTGKPVFVYYDSISAITSLLGYVRILKAYGGKWTKSKIMLIIDLEQGSIENTMFSSSISPLLKKILPMENIQYLHIGEKPEIILKKIHFFQPEFLGSDPNMLRKLAHLQNNTYDDDLNIQTIFSGGSMLDPYTKSIIENAFHSTVYNLYGCTEAGALAFECIEKGYHHVHSDLVYLEFLDEQGNSVPYNQKGSLVVTKLYGRGTPIIRYTGVEDFIIPLQKKTSCGITTQMIGNIEGRKVDMIILSNKKMISPLSITGIPAKIMKKYNSFKINQFQIIQHDVTSIEVLLVINNDMRNSGIPVSLLIQEMKKEFNNILGKDMHITIHEVDFIQKDKRSDYVQVVISKVKQSIVQ